MPVNGFFSSYWRHLLLSICGCAVIVGLACKTGGGGGGSSSSLLIITSVRSLNLNATGATISWSTNKPADSEVEYGLTTNYGNVMSVKTMDTTHSLTLIGLTPNTTYNYRAKSTDGAGSLSTSGNQTFTTMSGGSTPPPGPTPTPGPAPTPFPVVGVDESVGPFDSWTRVTTYGANGNDTTDDTTAIQQGLDALSAGSIKTLYFPKGKYLINQKLRLHNQVYVNLIGEDPDSTIFSWNGSSGGTMLEIDGVAYSRFNRLQFDGQNSAKVAVDQAKSDGGAQYFDTGNQYAEDVFKNVGIGIRAGNKDIGAAETSVVRSRFINNTIAGIAVRNFNALDWWIWYSYFEDCAVGATNYIENEPNTAGNQGGNFNVYHSVFKRSKVADLVTQSTQFFSFRYNYSIGSNRFYTSRGAGINGSLTNIQGNTILDTTDPTSIYIADFGPINIHGNFIRSRGTSGPAIRFTAEADVLAFNNTFTISNQIARSGGRFISDGNNIGTIVASEPVIPFKYVSANRPVFEVPPNSTTATIKQKIAGAAAVCGQRPIVHFQASNNQFLINETLEIPPNCDIQLVGDGGYSALAWSGSGTGPVIKLKGPSRATLRDLLVKGQKGDDVNGIIIENADQTNSRVYMQEVFVNVSSEHGLIVDGLSSARVDLRGFQHQDQHKDGDNTRSGSGIKIVGPTVNRGGRTILLSGAASSNNYTYEITGGNFVAKDVWYETGESQDVPRAAYMKLSGNPNVTFDQAKVFTIPVGTTPPAIDIQNFTGSASFISLDLQDRIIISGASTGKILALGLQGQSTANYFLNNSSGGADARLLNSRRYNGGTNVVNDIGSAEMSFLRGMLSQTSGADLSNEYESFPAGITDVRMYRVYVERTIAGIHIKNQ